MINFPNGSTVEVGTDEKLSSQSPSFIEAMKKEKASSKRYTLDEIEEDKQSN